MRIRSARLRKTVPSLAAGACVSITLLTLTGCLGSSEPEFADNTGRVDDFTCGNRNVLSSGDPLAACAWHLHNRGQDGFSGSGGTPGADINMIQAETDGIMGVGVKVAVSDTGLEIRHADLAANVIQGASKNYRTTGDPGDPTNFSSINGDHGTSVAGIIAAVKGNGAGSRGVAAKSGIAGLNFLARQTTSSKLDQISGDFDIFNQSWGVGISQSSVLDSMYLAQLEHGVKTLRAGKGALYVKAAGNFFGDGINCNADPNNTTPYTINVAAMNALGYASSYSSACSANWIIAPGGEFGRYEPAIITTDQSGCSKGYSRRGSPVSAFNAGGPGNLNCDFTSGFNGTSSAAPVVSGVIALMLDANPALSWRDVKHILASTARQVDASIPAFTTNLVPGLPNPPSGHVWEDPWITNAAGFKFHNWFGFGLVDADAAVALAQSYSEDLGSFVDLRESDGSWHYGSGSVSLAIPDASAAGITSGIAVTEDITIETVQVRVNVTHPYTGDIGIELTSPSGTKSILFNVNNGFKSSDDLLDMVLLSNAFYGEASPGTWTLKVLDGRAANTGTLESWEINISGRSGTFGGY